ncbi:hypothetical protein ACFX11_044735 [Malus domestica]
MPRVLLKHLSPLNLVVAATAKNHLSRSCHVYQWQTRVTSNENRILIHVKQGVYYENVLMDKSKWNVMMFGDGMTKTVVSSNLSFVDGTLIFSISTFKKEKGKVR